MKSFPSLFASLIRVGDNFAVLLHQSKNVPLQGFVNVEAHVYVYISYI
jgi:hypothetical protein